jgi:hypothetical protein
MTTTAIEPAAVANWARECVSFVQEPSSRKPAHGWDPSGGEVIDAATLRSKATRNAKSRLWRGIAGVQRPSNCPSFAIERTAAT